MKVLIVSGCVYAENCGRKSFSGLDYVVSEIAQKVGTEIDVNVYTITPYPKNCFINKIPIRSYTYRSLLKYLSVRDIAIFCRLIKKSQTSLKRAVKYIRSYLISKDVANLCKKEKFDLIHINGADLSCLMISLAASESNIPVLFSLHGLISYGTPNMPKADKEAEKTILRLSGNYDFLMTCVSTGIKSSVMADMNISNQNIMVINNAVHFEEETNADYWYRKYPKIKGKNVVVCVGTIGKNKNQEQILRAFKMLPNDIKSTTMILLAGHDTTNGEIDKIIEENNLNNYVIKCGFLSKKEVSGLFKIASANVLLSYSEGFGLSFIEAAYFGVPSLTFEDLDAAKDIYTKESMILLPDREDRTVANGLIEILKRQWDKSTIKRSANRFTNDIYLGYCEAYNRINSNNSNKIMLSQLKREIGI